MYYKTYELSKVTDTKGFLDHLDLTLHLFYTRRKRISEASKCFFAPDGYGAGAGSRLTSAVVLFRPIISESVVLMMLQEL